MHVEKQFSSPLKDKSSPWFIVVVFLLLLLFFVVVVVVVVVVVLAFKVLCSTCGGGILILRQRNLSKQCLLRFLCLSIKILFTVHAVKRFKDCNTKLDHAKLLSLVICYLCNRQDHVSS